MYSKFCPAPPSLRAEIGDWMVRVVATMDYDGRLSLRLTDGWTLCAARNPKGGLVRNYYL